MTTKRWTLCILAAALLLAYPAIATAQQEEQEHPEHPEHPEEGEATAPALTEAELADAIEAHVAEVAEENDGVYPLVDPESGETLNLELVKVHEERLARTAPDTYFACVDFAGPDGTTYDVDFFMTGASAEELEFQEFSIHKVDGAERYTWHEEEGVWKQKPVGEEGGDHEHPEESEEHPEHPEEPPPPPAG